MDWGTDGDRRDVSNDSPTPLPHTIQTDYPTRIVILLALSGAEGPAPFPTGSEHSTVGVYPDPVGVPRKTLRGELRLSHPECSYGTKNLSSNSQYLRD